MWPTILHDVLINILQDWSQTSLTYDFFTSRYPRRQICPHIKFQTTNLYSTYNNLEASLPLSIVIRYEDTNYRIFVTDDLTCYQCKSQRHTAANCPHPLEDNTNYETINATPPTNNPVESGKYKNESDTNDTTCAKENNAKKHTETAEVDTIPVSQKRPA